MSQFSEIVRRWNWWADTIVPIAAFAAAWWLGWGPWVAVGVAVAARIVAAIVKPRRPGRLTE